MKRIVAMVVLGIGGFLAAIALTMGALALAGDAAGTVVQPHLTPSQPDDRHGHTSVSPSPEDRTSPSPDDHGGADGSGSDDSTSGTSGSDSSGPGSGDSGSDSGSGRSDSGPGSSGSGSGSGGADDD
jgi:hypothetical protein